MRVARLAWPVALLAACAGPSQTATPAIGRAVIEAIEATGRAHVLVTLRDPVGAAAAAAEREAAVALAQEALLGRLPRGEFTLVRRYRSIPGLALVVTKRAFEILQRDPGVASIEMDEPGGVSAPPGRPAD